jgi:hypothetical protein
MIQVRDQLCLKLSDDGQLGEVVGKLVDSLWKSRKTNNARVRKDACALLSDDTGLGAEEKNGKRPASSGCLQQSQHFSVVVWERIAAHHPHISSTQIRFRLAPNFMQRCCRNSCWN